MFLLRRCVTRCTLKITILNQLNRRYLYRHHKFANLENVAVQPVVTLLFGRIFTNVSKEKCRFTTNAVENEPMSLIEFEKISDETLESLTEYFEELIETVPHLNNADVSYSSGVLTINFGKPYGTYVINRQSPNRQIWLSSPTSGPKRYDFTQNGRYWVYKHDGKPLHRLLQDEIPVIVKTEVDFSKCCYSQI